MGSFLAQIRTFFLLIFHIRPVIFFAFLALIPCSSLYATNLGLNSGFIRGSSYSGYEISLMGSYPVFSYGIFSASPAIFSGLNQMSQESEQDLVRTYKQIDEKFISLGIDTQIKIGSRLIFQTDFFVGKISSNLSDRQTSSDLSVEASMKSVSGIRYDISPSLNYQIASTDVYLSVAFNYSIHRYDIDRDPDISGERLTNEGKFSLTSSQKTGFKLQANNTPWFDSKQNTYGTSFGIKIKL